MSRFAGFLNLSFICAWLLAAPSLRAAPVDSGPAAGDGAVLSKELVPLEDNVDMIEPPYPWAPPENSSGTGRLYVWLQGQMKNWHELSLFAQPAPSSGVDAADIRKAFLDAASQQATAGGKQVITAPEVVPDPRFVARIHWRVADSDGAQTDCTRMIRFIPGHLVDAYLQIQIASDKQVKTNAAITKLAEDVLLSVVPHGQPAPAPVSFDAKALLLRFPGDGVNLGDKPQLHSTNALNGKPLDFAQYRGKVVVVDFWATWCGPCMNMAPHMVELNQKYAASGVQIIGITLDTDKAKMQEVTKQQGMDWPQAFLGKAWDNPVARIWAVKGIPYTAILNPEGAVVFVGYPENLSRMIPAALKAFPPGAPKPELAGPRVAPTAAPASGITAAGPSNISLDSSVSPAASPADALAAARQLKGTDPAQAYAAFKSIVKASPRTPAGVAAAQEAAAMEQDAVVSRKIMRAEGDGKAYSALGMAQSLQAAKQTDKAAARFQQIITEYPDTLCAAFARRGLDEIKNAPAPAPAHE